MHFYSKNGHFSFLSPPSLGGLEAVYDVHLRLNGKHVVDFLLVITELLSLGIMAEKLRANIDWNSAFFKQVRQFDPKFQV